MIKFLIKNEKVSIFSVIFVFVLFFYPQISKAVETPSIYFQSTNTVIGKDSNFFIDVFLNTSVPINALDLQVYYPVDKFKFISSDNRDSIVDIWQNNPNTFKTGHIQLTGAIFKTFSGKGGKVTTISFKTLDSLGETKIFFERNNLYLADGKGTKILANISPFFVSINNNNNNNNNASYAAPKDDDVDDGTPPEVFLSFSGDLFGGNSLIIFNAIDKEVGIKTTEMRTKKWFFWSDWKIVQNPVLHEGGVWGIEIRSMNNGGLSTIKNLYLVNKLILKLILIFLSFFFVVSFLKMYNKNRQK